jgi:hypothetical protein
MSTRDKIVMFNGANSVVGAIGGGLANLLFSRPETKLIVLVSPTFLDINSRFKYSFVKVNTIYFTHTYHENKDEFKKYMRIKTIRHGNVITGEIIEVYKESVLVSYADSSNIGWNNQNNYECEKFKKYQIEKLDKGLNSPWVCDIEKLSSICNL